MSAALSHGIRSLAGFALAALTIDPVFAHELLVSRTPENALRMEMINGPIYHLEPSEFPEFPGFVSFDPGFVALAVDDPGTDRFRLPDASDIEFVLIGAEPHIQVWNDTGTAPMLIGETFSIGAPLFHAHPVWHSPDGTPGEHYHLQIQLRDRAGLVADSPVYTVGFEPVPEPASLALLLIGGALAGRRWR